MFISLARIIKFSLQDIGRNIWLSLVTIVILVLTLFSVNMLLAVRAISSTAVSTIKQKIDMSIYLKPDAPAERISFLQAKIAEIPYVGEVRFVSKEEALANFTKNYQRDAKISEALRELGGVNPLSPSLVVKPKNLNDFNALIQSLQQTKDPIIEAGDFDNHKEIIDKIDAITKKVSDAGLIVSLLFVVVTLLVIYNTARVAIYTHRNEIAIMRLVGASNWFIRGPFLLSSLIYTLIGMVLLVSIFYVFLNLLQPYLETFFASYNFNIINYFSSNFVLIFGAEFVVAALVNLLAAWWAVGRYTKV
jgi:cell division transport system permease protein